MRQPLRVLIFLCLTTLAAPAHAFESRAGGTVVVGDPVQDDLYVTGGTVEVTAAVDGDLTAAGGTLSLSGPISGGVLAAGGTVRIGGTAGRAVRAAAGQLTIDGRMASDVVIAGGSVLISQGTQIGRDLVAGGGSIDLSGSIGRNALLSGGDVTIGGTVPGNVQVQAGRLVVLSSARIAGSLRHNADARVDIQPGAQISGGVQPIAAMRRRGPMGSGLGGRVIELLWLLVAGFVLLALAPRAVSRVSERVGSQFWHSLLVGFILLIVIPAVAIILLVTVVGIPLALVAVALYLVTLYLGQIAVARWAGQRIFRRATASPYLSYTIGAIVVIVLFALPFLGWIARLIAVLVGFGALWAVAWALRRPRALAIPPAGAGD